MNVFSSIEEISSMEWDSVLPDENLFHRHAFLQALEHSKVENSKFQYLIFKQKDQVVGTVVISTFDINLDLFIGESQIIQIIKKLFPRIFKIKVVFCGTPLSAGHHNIFYCSEIYLSEIMRLTSNFINEYCKGNSIKYSIFKEMDQALKSKFIELEKYSYFWANSLPTVKLNVNKFEDYNHYLQSMRSTFRRQVRNSIEKIGMKYPEIYSDTKHNTKNTYFICKNVNISNAAEFYSMYLEVLNRAKVKLESLNKEFFTNLFSQTELSLKEITLFHNNQNYGSLIFAIVANEMIFIWAGKYQSKDEIDSYSNLMNAMFYYAFQNHCKTIHLGQTSYYPKLRMGGKTEPLFIFFKAHQKWRNSLLRLSRSWLFPEYNIPSLHVFKE